MPSHMVSCVILKTDRSVLIDGGGGLVAKECSALVTPQTVARQAPLSMGFPRQEHWSGCHFLLQGIFLTQGSNPHRLHCRQIHYC